MVRVLGLAAAGAVLLASCSNVAAGGGDGGGGGGGGGSGGPFWTSFTVADPGPIQVGSVTVTGPYTVARIEVNEEFPASWLALCEFGASDTAASKVFSPGYQFTATRSAGTSGATEIRLSSTVANLPLIKVYLVTADGTPAWELYVRPTGGVHGPGGQVYADPYEHKDLKFAPYSQLTFTSKKAMTITQFQEKALQPLLDAGYTAANFSYSQSGQGSVYVVDVTNSFDGRKKIEDDIVLKKWKAVSHKGNMGTYEIRDKYKGTAKASMSVGYPPLAPVKAWEITAEFTFEADEDQTTQGLTTFSTTGGTLNQICYTVPDPTGAQRGEPSSVIIPYTIRKEDGTLSLDNTADPPRYSISGSITDTSQLKVHPYLWYISPILPPEEAVLDVDAQVHAWLLTGDGMKQAGADGSLKGAYTGQNGLSLYQWDISPAAD